VILKIIKNYFNLYKNDSKDNPIKSVSVFVHLSGIKHRIMLLLILTQWHTVLISSV
jgi:hypothetical protein